ncbi:replication factor-a protein [Pholiota conissans]|uniref:Replication protein A subunit n=1 Tax=Pholiota conissans TaxID=109636 RepID=A0A9P5Z9T7_9AGAR|nr:replication factor-a protein [Pholiota conissans]
MVHQLSAGSCKRLQNASPDDVDVFESQHTLQFLSIKKVGNNPGAPASAPDRYRIIMSDGINYMQAMLATQLNHMVQDNTIGRNTIAVVEKLTCNYVQEKRLVIILSLRVLELTAEKIGDPSQIGPSEMPAVASPSTGNGPSAPPAQATPEVASPAQAAPAQAAAAPRQQAPPQTRHGNIYPIEGLSPYQNNWTIKARVTQKSEIKTWSNARGEGKLFNVTLMDDSGEIRGTGFNLVVDDLYPRLEEGKVYYISKARVNLAKKKFSNINNDYELSFERNTEVEECHEVTNVPTIKYNFVPLNGLEDLSKDAICDVIAVVKETSPVTQITSAKLQRELAKRELTLVDKSGFSVRMTLWGKQAEQYNVSEPTPVIAFKGVKVGDFGGRSLSMFSGSTMQVNPEIDECFALRGWYDNIGAEQTFKAHSNTGGGSSMYGFKREEIRSLDEIKQAGYGEPDKPENFSARATIMHIKSDNISYPACPTTNCNKKVVEMGDSWRCEKCNQNFPTPEHRYIMSLAVADYSGQAWLQGFNDVGTTIFGMTANQLLEIKDRDINEYNAILHKANCNTYNFSCRAKQDTYNETTRIRYGISRIIPLNYKEEAQMLRDLLYSPWAR